MADHTADHAGGLDGLRVAVVNWRDPWHPAAGGAEVYAFETSRALLARGARIHYLTARAPGRARTDRREGIEIRRMGGRWSVYPRVLGWLLLRRRRFDAVIDCQNGIPFFTPWVVSRRTAVVLVVHHVHDAQFALHFPPWLAAVGRFLEGPVARRVYRRCGTVAVSRSTVVALRERLRWPGRIEVVPNGCPAGAGRAADRSPAPTVACLGRLVAHKRVDRVVLLAGALRAVWPGLRVEIVGRGPEEASLRDLVASRDLGEAVTLHGYLDEPDKRAVLDRAWLHVSASAGEGWGQSVLEAAAAGVPTVAYDVDGLRDAIRPGETGWLVPAGGDPTGGEVEDLCRGVEAALRELADPARRDEIAEACRRWAGGFTWERTGAGMTRVLLDELDRQRGRARDWAQGRAQDRAQARGRGAR